MPGVPSESRNRRKRLPKRPGIGRRAPPPSPAAPPRKPPGETLDGSWDRRLSRGLVSPDAMLDLHGHNLATAYDLLDRRLEQAIGSGARLMLLVTGKPPGAERPAKRGAIRAAVGDWLACVAGIRDGSPRSATPIPGTAAAGALYIVLRRPRD